MDHVQLTRWLRISLRRHYNTIERQLLTKPDHRLLLSIRTARVDEFLGRVAADIYLNELIRMYIEGYTTDVPVETILRRIEKKRVELYNQQWSGIEYNQPFYPVDDFVEERKPEKILKLIVCWYASYHARTTYTKIRRALDENATQDELHKIMQDARSFDQKTPQQNNTPPFEWLYPAQGESQTRLLYEGLMMQRLIALDTTLPVFSSLFGTSSIKQRVRWAGPVALLLVLFSRLHEKNILVSGKSKTVFSAKAGADFSVLFEPLKAAFIDSKGKPLTNRQLVAAVKKAQTAFENKEDQSVELVYRVLERLDDPRKQD